MFLVWWILAALEQTILISFKMASKEVVSAIDPVADSGCLTGRGGDK